jgi:CTP synthase
MSQNTKETNPQAENKARGSSTDIKKPKIIVVTGGVLSGLGKGIACASMGNILKRQGFKVNIQKFDPYLNSDAGTLNPGEHGECFVTDDGGETDLDLGHYERFLNEKLTRDSSVMAGRIYAAVIENERKGLYLGKTVQVIPQVTDMIKSLLWKAAQSVNYDIHIVEIGGTVGDYEGVVFHEAMRQLHLDVGRENVLYVHLVFLPYLEASGEVKSKPAQNSVRDLRNIGIQPDVLVVRSDYPIPEKVVVKLAQFTNVTPDAIVTMPTLESVYEAPLVMQKYGLDKLILKHFGIEQKAKFNNGHWEKLVKTIKQVKPKLKIAIVGKYLDMKDTYMSLTEALKSACWNNGRDLEIIWVDAEEIEKKKLSVTTLKKVAGIVVPGGFGKRGTEGKITAIRFARENNIPYLGLCLGMQLATIEFARNVACIADAASEEFNPKSTNHVIHIMESQKGIDRKGGTMRLGAWPCTLKNGSRARELYGKKDITERHRHRFEFNNFYRETLEAKGLLISGTTPDNKLVEMIEIPDHPFFIASQFHPEFNSRPNVPHPLFDGFVKATIKDRS